MARKTIFVSDLSGKQIDPSSAVKITVAFADARKGQYVIDGASRRLGSAASRRQRNEAGEAGAQTEDPELETQIGI